MKNHCAPRRFKFQIISFFIVCILCLAVSVNTDAQTCNLPSPNHIITGTISSCSVYFHWNKVAGAKGYLVKYKRSSSLTWKGNWKATDTTFTIAGLKESNSYDVSVQSVCKNGIGGSSKTISVITTDCTLPISFGATQIANEEQISITSSCPFDTLYCRYGVSVSNLNLLIYSTAGQITLTNLLAATKYFYQVSTCALTSNNFTPVDSFTFSATAKPNIILIILDDARYDQYSCNGAPAFMQTPNIDRIANEGINFKNMCTILSECAPSRASIATGVYPNKHGVVDNISQPNLNSSLPLLPDILHKNGYYTALIGKNHAIFKYANGSYFDYWLEFKSLADGYDRSYLYFKQNKTIPGYSTDVLTDSAVKIISTSTQPFFLWLAYHAPHDPLIPSDEYSHTFDNEQMPLGIDTVKYTQNYPSFLDELSNIQSPPKESKNNMRETFEMLLSVDDGVGRILHALDSIGQLNNTLIIFTSDNGHMLGEHQLDMKRVAYEQSLRLPLFVRYPAWFPSHSIDTSNFALSVDLAPTILDAAGIDSDFAMDGVSVKKFYDGISSRNSMYYHYWYSTEGPWIDLPSIHAVRDKHYIFIDYGCASDTTQEFFDLINDPLELTNQINNSAYSSLISNYRELLEQMKVQYSDTTEETVLNCYLANEVFDRREHVQIANGFLCFPNPASDVCNIQSTGGDELDFKVFNELGQQLQCFRLLPGELATLNNLPKGILLLKATDENYSETVRLLIQ